jgi:hypothetical protein
MGNSKINRLQRSALRQSMCVFVCHGVRADVDVLGGRDPQTEG